MRFASLFLLAVLVSPWTRAEEIPADDLTIVPNVRVGPIEKGMTLFGLKTVYGGGKVKAAKLDGAEGETIDGAKLFEGTDRELQIIFNPEGDEREVFDIRIIGKAWKFTNGLKIGLTMTEVEKINGKPFQMAGFNWDYGGYGNFDGGKLEGVVSVRFDPGEKDVDDSLSGDRQISTSDKKLRALNPKVSDLTVSFR